MWRTDGALVTKTQIWIVSNLGNRSFEDLVSILRQIASDPECTDRVLLDDVGEMWNKRDLTSSTAVRLLWERL